jgi:hypothetical protein
MSATTPKWYAAKWYAECASSGPFDRTTVHVILDLWDEFKHSAGLGAARIELR